MAQVGAPLPPRAAAIFNAVFPPSSHARPGHDNKRVRLTVDSPTIKKELSRFLKPLLGIDLDTRYAFGLDGPTAEGHPFLLPAKICSPMRLVRRPNQADFLQQRSRYLKSPVWNSIRAWQGQLGSEGVHKPLAEVLDDLLNHYVRCTYSGAWTEDVVPHLEFWVEHVFSGLVQMCLEYLSPSSRTQQRRPSEPTGLGDVRRWKDIALTTLAALRVEELFDMIVAWDESVNGINDLRQCITSPATRTYLTTHFADALSSRLLHPGSSTIEILQHYISIIKAFRKLDPKGVLLDRVAKRVRKYLKDRDDTVKVIVSGLLSDPLDAAGVPIPPSSDTLSELALELIRRDESDDKDDDYEFDWDNMDWVPDPIDAAPDYMKSKNTDVIGSLTSLFESKDVFVKELQTTLADRLLKNKADFDLEISVVNHLKQRFGDTALQSCEVMLRDVLESRKVDEVIRREQGQETLNSQIPIVEQKPELHAKILSRLFWPSLSSQTFNLPTPITTAQTTYETGFAHLKESRKLTWLNSVGHVEVELHLEDRTVVEEVLPYQATVIYAFQDPTRDEHQTSPPPPPPHRSVTELAHHLEMAETLVRSACMYWVSRRVLFESSKDIFSVLERLPSTSTTLQPTTSTTNTDTRMSNTKDPAHPNPQSPASASIPTSTSTSQSSTAALAAAAEAAAHIAQKEADDTDRKAKMQIYHQFVVSMLTNQGAMPLGRVAMMLGMVVPGGFPFGTDELREFLGGMVREGVLEVGFGGNYRVV